MSRLNISNSNLKHLSPEGHSAFAAQMLGRAGKDRSRDYSQDQVGDEADAVRRAATVPPARTTPSTPDLSGGPVSADENSCCLRPALEAIDERCYRNRSLDLQRVLDV